MVSMVFSNKQTKSQRTIPRRSRGRLRPRLLNNQPFKSIMMAKSASERDKKQMRPFDTDSFEIAIDNCASAHFTNTKSNFFGNLMKTRTRVQGIGTKEITVKGKVNWKITDDLGQIHTLTVLAYYEPSLQYRLLSPQKLAQDLRDVNGTGCLTKGDRVQLFWNNHKYSKTVMLNANNIAVAWSAPGITRLTVYAASQAEESNHESSQELTDANKERTIQESTARDSKQEASQELLRWHVRLGHAPMNHLRKLAQIGTIPRRLAKSETPKCASCEFGKASRKPWRSKPQQGIQNKIKETTFPGECISVDQMESPSPGLVAQIKGIPTTKRYHAATVFVDHFSRLSYIYLQFTITAEETILAKVSFETYARSHGVQIHHYHADNGRFAENMWMAHVTAARNPTQSISFCGVNAHFQNGIAEKRIRDLQDQARTMMIHAAHRWPRAISNSLWPYAMRLANEIRNCTMMVNAKTPVEHFSGVSLKPRLKEFHQFSCPAYVLINQLQAQQKVSKWLERARIGIYLGLSPRHATNISLILNPRTGLVSPQFHVRYDDNFDTVKGTDIAAHGQWKMITKFSKIHSSKISHNDNMQRQQDSTPSQNQERSSSQRNLVHPDINQVSQESQDFDLTSENNAEQHDQTSIENTDAPASTREHKLGQQPTRRSLRQWKPTQRYLQSVQQEELVFSASLEVAKELDEDKDENPLLAFAASADPDTMHYHKAMKQEDSKEFKKAMQQELNAHTESGNWILIELNDVPTNNKVLDAVWAMKRKRKIKSREIYKWKSRINVHGGQQEYGINYWDTFAPVVSWAAIRLVLILSIIKGWYTRQVDFVLAFPQAKAECDIFMKIPRGVVVQKNITTKELRLKVLGISLKQDEGWVDVENSKYVLKLVNNLYGQKQASRVWNQQLHKGLLEIGFVQSKVEDCLYYRNKTMFLVYVDNGILAGPDRREIQEIIKQLASCFNVTDEGDITDYLGVNVMHLPDGRIKLAQPHLIKQILKDVNFRDNTKGKSTPAASTKILDKDEQGENHNADWNYRSVIGKLLFLEKSTRGELAYAVHQAARFSQNPKRSHTEAVHRICKYLAATQDEGLILNPGEQVFECWPDADFCGLWNKDTAGKDKDTAKSRTGYVITFAKCAVLWASKLQGEFALSTTEAELISMSTALREVIPLMNLLEEMVKQQVIGHKCIPQVHCNTFEDNAGALEIARNIKFRPRTKHINSKYFHFKQHVENGQIQLHKCSTEEQVGDLFTKPLGSELFNKHVEVIFGWSPEKCLQEYSTALKRGSVRLQED